ncbi:MAG TPA: GcrA family cell cycle regulator [Saliniramus sp.]|nr:GcrA family cell cycle regulator [Saliniramus sp.]
MTDSGVTWNDERVEQLKKLWAEGRSASQIAAEIGGVSRNAVIGKVHRLGLSGRAKAPGASPARPREKVAIPPRPAAVPQQVPAQAAASPRPPQPASIGATALAQPRLVEPVAEQVPEPTVRPAPVAEVVVPIAECVTIMDLREGMCRWPIGDPTSPDFRFCGASAYTGVPYCDHHSQLAYQPSADRRREKKIMRG